MRTAFAILIAAAGIIAAGFVLATWLSRPAERDCSTIAILEVADRFGVDTANAYADRCELEAIAR